MLGCISRQIRRSVRAPFPSPRRTKPSYPSVSIFMSVGDSITPASIRSLIANVGTVISIEFARHKAPKHDGTAASQRKWMGYDQGHFYDWFAYGHVHHFGTLINQGKLLIRNGSLMGIEDYSESLGYWQPAEQTIFIVDPSMEGPNRISRIIPVFFGEPPGDPALKSGTLARVYGARQTATKAVASVVSPIDGAAARPSLAKSG